MSENPLFDKMYQHYLNGTQNFSSFSRLQKLEYAYQTLACVRDLYCSEHNVDPKNIDVCFARMPGSNGRSTWKTVENDRVTETRVALEIADVLKPTTTVQSLFTLISHEMGHSIDAITRADFTTEHHQLYSLGIDTFKGPGWWGRKDEKIADEFANQNMLRIFDKQISENPNNQDLITQRLNFAKEYSERAELHDNGAKELAKLVKQAEKQIENGEFSRPQLKPMQNAPQMPENRLVAPAIRNTKAFVEKIIETEKISNNPQGDPRDPLFIYPNTITAVANESQFNQIANTPNYFAAEGQDKVPLNSSPFEEVQDDTLSLNDGVTKNENSTQEIQPAEQETITEQNFDTENMSPDALRDLNEVIKIQSNNVQEFQTEVSFSPDNPIND